jgi:acetoacetate decarboxylase
MSSSLAAHQAAAFAQPVGLEQHFLDLRKRSVAELPILEILSAIHIRADLTLGLGKVVHDYLQQPIRSSRANERALVT